MKKLITFFIAFFVTVMAWADDSGSCGGWTVTYTYVESTGTLTISGVVSVKEYMANYESSSDRPWNAYCSSIKNVVINNGVTSIGKNAFYGCTGLTSVTIGNDVTSIGNQAFKGCTGLTSVTIPNSVTEIGSDAFNGCTGLTSVTIPNSVTTIESAAFSGCTGLTSINVAEDNLNYASIDGVLYSKDKKTLIKCPQGKTGSVTIPNSVTSIESGAFSSCGLTSINVAEDNLNYASVDGVLYNKDKNTLIMYPQGKTGSITIPNSVTSIRNYAFDGCTGLTSVTIPNSVTSIGESAFSGCTGLTSITIGNGVTSIGEAAFLECTGLTSMTVEATNPPLCVNEYGYGLGMPSYSIPLYVPAGSVDAYKAADEWKKFTNIQAIPATGVKETAAEKSEVKKIMIDGTVYIEAKDMRYNLNGQKVK